MHGHALFYLPDMAFARGLRRLTEQVRLLRQLTVGAGALIRSLEEEV